jgi:hypothetical protein
MIQRISTRKEVPGVEKDYFQELKHYTLYGIAKELKTDIDETKRLIGILKKYGIVKAVNKSKPEFEDLSNQDIILTDVSENEQGVEYVFDFVGVVVLEGHVFKCYPKYITSTKEPLTQLKQVLKVIKKYNSKEQLIYLYNGEDDSQIFNHLAISLHLLEEYFVYGLYTNQQDIIEINGEGEILWDRTINETFALIENNRPYYVELQTHNNVDNDMDYFKRLHECILSICSRELRKTGLLELFELSDAVLSDTAIEDFGDTDYILYRLQNEIQIQYVTRKQNLLKTLYTYIANNKTDENDVSLSLYGTNSFNLVWEKVCAENFGSILDESLEKIEKLGKLPVPLVDEYKVDKKHKQKLINLIERPVWHGKQKEVVDDKVDTLIPDLICSYPCNENGDYCFGIYDAKYYKINFKKKKEGWKVTGQPGVGDVTKQYLYQLAYDDFIVKQGFRYVQNMFFCPAENDNGEKYVDYGYVEMDMLHTIGKKTLENIAVVKLCAEEMYDLYLKGKHIENMVEYIPQISQKTVMEQNFASRMMAYSRRIREVSLEAELKLQMDTEKGKLIYPKQLKKEIGAKLIYDAICPVATSAFYDFDPYERKYGNASMVAESTTYYGDDSCSQIADVAINIEQHIKRLNDTELQDPQIVKVILRQCFKGTTKVDSMAQGNSLDKLCDRVMELIREVYL